MSALTAVPPALLVFALAAAVATLPRRAGHALAVAGSLATCGWVLAVPAGTHVQARLFGFEAVLFHVDPYSRLLAAVLAFVAAAAVAYAHATDGDRRQVALSLAYVGAGVGAALAGDWLTLVVCWELLAVCATALLWTGADDPRIGSRYAVFHELGGLALIGGVLAHYASAGTFVFGDGVTAGLPAALVALGIGVNAGFVGLHVWLVDSYARPDVATSVVLAAVTTKVGAYALVRAFPAGHAAVAYLGGAMVLVGVSFAILQTDVRRLLSYHVVSQVGYMVAGFGAGTALARAGAIAHLVNNVLYKSLLFMIAGVLILRTGHADLKRIDGAGRSMPLLAVAFAVAALSIAGIPGFNGFVSKGLVLDGVQKAGLTPLRYALVLGGVGTVISFLKFGYYAFLHGDGDDHADLGWVERVALGALAALCVVIGLRPSLLFEVLPAAGVASAKPFAAKQFIKVGAVTAVGVVAFAVLRAPLSRVAPVPDLGAVYYPAGRRLLVVGPAAAAAVESGVDRAGGGASGVARTLVDRVRALRGRLPGAGRTVGAGVLAVALALAALLALLFA